MPMHIERCNGCEETDHLEEVQAKNGYFYLCRYCRETLEEEEYLETEDGRVIEL